MVFVCEVKVKLEPQCFILFGVFEGGLDKPAPQQFYILTTTKLKLISLV